MSFIEPKKYVYIDRRSYDLLAQPNIDPTLSRLMLALQTEPAEAWDISELMFAKRPVATLSSALDARGDQAVRETLALWWSGMKLTDRGIVGVRDGWSELVVFSPILGAWALHSVARFYTSGLSAIADAALRRRWRQARDTVFAHVDRAVFTGSFGSLEALSSDIEEITNLYTNMPMRGPGGPSMAPILVGAQLMMSILGMLQMEADPRRRSAKWHVYAWDALMFQRGSRRPERTQAAAFHSRVRHQLQTFPYSAWG